MKPKLQDKRGWSPSIASGENKQLLFIGQAPESCSSKQRRIRLQPIAQTPLKKFGGFLMGARKSKPKQAPAAALSPEVQQQTQAVLAQSQAATQQIQQQAQEQQRLFAEQQAASQQALQRQQEESAKQQQAYAQQLQAYLQQLQQAQEQQRQATLQRQAAEQASASAAQADAEASSTQLNLFASQQAANQVFKQRTSGSQRGSGRGFLA